MSQLTEAPKRVLSPYAPKLLLNLQCQGKSNNCGPYTTAVIVNSFRNTELEGDKLAEEMNNIAWRGILPIVRRLRNSATFPWGMVDVFLRHDLAASWSLFTSVNKLLASLNAGEILMPVIGTWKPLYAHVMTLIAWDEKEGFGFANTQYPTKEIYWMPAENFTRMWKNTGNLLVRIKKVA
jgi:hypothetical protein